MLAATELCHRCRHNNQGSELAEALAEFELELSDDAEAVHALMDRFALRRDREPPAENWVLDKVRRFEDGQNLAYSPLNRLLELEGLQAETHSRRAMWATLSCCLRDPELGAHLGLLFRRDRAERRVRVLEGHRLEATTMAFNRS